MSPAESAEENRPQPPKLPRKQKPKPTTKTILERTTLAQEEFERKMEWQS